MIRRSFTAFGGAACEVLAVDAGAGAGVHEVVLEVRRFERRFTRFDPSSELSRFNATAGRHARVSPLLEALLRVCLDAYALSDGLVNAGCLTAVVAAGYDRTISDVRASPASARAGGPAAPVPPLPDTLVVGAGWARLRPGASIDLGGVAKGWLADRLCERFDNAVVNLGGDLRVRGEGLGGGWTVGLCDGTVVIARDAGIATSGTSARRWQGGHHLIDPRTGASAATDAAAISVVAADALTAEVLAKAACLVGCAAAPDWLEHHGAARHASTRDAMADPAA